MAKKSIGAVLTLKDGDFRSKMRQANQNWDKFQNEAKRSKQAMAQFEKSTQRAKASISNLGRELAGGALAVVGIGSAIGIVGKAVNEASNMEQYRNTLNVVMKDTQKAAETMKWAADFANKTPFETAAVVDATVKLQSYGLTAKKVMPSIGNMAAVMNKDLNQAVEAVADAQTGELERLKEFGITKQMIVDQANKTMRGKQVVNNKGQITDQKAFNQALFSLMNDRFKGGMDTQAKTFKGTMSTITGVFSTALAEMAGVSSDGTIRAGSLFDTIRTKAESAGKTLQKWQEDGTIQAISRDFNTAFNAVSSVLGGVVKGIGWARRNSEWLIPVLSGLFVTMAGFKALALYTSLMKAWKTGTIAATIAQRGLNLTMLGCPLGLIVVGIGLAIAAGVALYRNWDKVKSKLTDIWIGLGNFFKTWVNNKIEGINLIIKGMNHIPGVKIPLIKKLELTNVTKLKGTADFFRAGRNALGTSYWRGGLTWVGEQGPELVNLPKGSQVHSNSESKSIAGKGLYLQKLAETIIIREEADIQKMVDALMVRVVLEMDNM